MRNRRRPSVVLALPSHLVMLTGTTPTKRHSDMQRRRTLLGALVVIALTAAGCSTRPPTPAPTEAAKPTASTQPKPAPSAVAAEPTVVCQAPAFTHVPESIRITLTCENAVAAARAVVGPDPAVTSIAFKFGLWCPAGRPCLAIAVFNGGYVTFRRYPLGDLVVVVTADQAGKVTASDAYLDPT
jgi:hypothetical protein